MNFLAVSLVLVGSLIAVGNGAGCVQAYLRKRRGEEGGFSCVPLLSLSCCVVAWLLSGDELGAWLLVPAILDPANWSLVALPVFLLFRSRESTRATQGRGRGPEQGGATAWDERLARIQQMLIGELERSAAHHEAGRYGELGATFDEIEDLVWTFESKRFEQTLEFRAYRLLDAWIDASNHDWLHHEPVGREDWPRLARMMREALEGRREFRPEEYRGIFP